METLPRPAETPSVSETPRPSALPVLVGAGLYAGLAQVILLRQLLNVAAGNELTIGLMLAVWLLSAALGAWAAGRGARGDVRRAYRRVWVANVLTCGALVWGIDAARTSQMLLSWLPGSLAVQPGEIMGLGHLVAVSVVVTLPAGAVSGALFASLLRLQTELHGEQPRVVGEAYAADGVGHLIGGVASALLTIVGISPSHQMVVAVLAPLLPFCYMRAVATAACRKDIVAAVAGLSVTTAILLGLAGRMEWFGNSARWGDRGLITQTDTIYGNLAVTKFGEKGVYFYRDGVPDSCSPPTPAIQYLVHFPLLQTPRPREVLLIGGGATGGLQEVLKHSPTSVDYVELDPMLITLAREFVVGDDQRALSDPRVHVHNLDGRLFVKQAGRQGKQYDAVIVSVPAPGTAQINRFYTREFFAEVKGILRPETGVLGLQVPSSETYLGDELLRLNAVITRTLQTVFPNVALLPGEEMVIAASPQLPLSEDSDVLRKRMAERGVRADDFQAHVWDRLFAFTLDQVRENLQQAPPLPLNTDARPIGYFYGQAYWVAQFSRTSWTVFEALSRLRLWHLLAAVAAGLLLFLGLGKASPRARAAVPLTVLGSGAVAMALEVTLLLAFQVYYGFVYLEVGIITGAFMVGLALGGWRTARYADSLETDECYRLLAAVQVVIAVLAISLPGLLGLVGGVSSGGLLARVLPHLVFPLLTAVVGFAVGIEFPLASRAAGTTEQSRAGASLYAMDLCGAALGALLAGTIVLPVLGLMGTCVAAAAVSVGLGVLLAAQTPKLEDPACEGCAR
jgi:spermidine synthase